MKNVNIAIVGTNFISDKLISAAKVLDGITVAAVYSRTDERGRFFAEKHGIAKCFCDYDSMLADSQIDCVYVASPTFLHAEHSIRALLAGKHVLCEKSVCLNSEEFIKIKKTVLKTGRVFLEAMRPAHDPALAELKKQLGEIGKIRRAHFEFCKYSSRYDNFKIGIIENAFDPALKNSALSDIGVYPLWLAVKLFGEPEKLFSSSIKLSNGFDGAGSVILDYNDFIASIEYSKITESNSPSVIEGEEGSLFINKISEPHSIVLQKRNSSPVTVYTNSCENNMIYELSAFLEMIKGKREFLPYISDSEALIRTMDRIAEFSGIL